MDTGSQSDAGVKRRSFVRLSRKKDGSRVSGQDRFFQKRGKLEWSPWRFKSYGNLMGKADIEATRVYFSDGNQFIDWKQTCGLCASHVLTHGNSACPSWAGGRGLGLKRDLRCLVPSYGCVHDCPSPVACMVYKDRAQV